MLLHQLTIPIPAPRRKPKPDTAAKRLEKLARVMLLQLDGWSQAAAAEQERLSMATLWRYQQAFAANGLKGLVPKKPPGRPPKGPRKPKRVRSHRYQLLLKRV
jgi:transposase